MNNNETINKLHLNLLSDAVEGKEGKETNFSCLSYLYTMLDCKVKLLDRFKGLAAKDDSPSWRKDRSEITKKVLGRVMLLEKYYVVVATSDLDETVSGNWYVENLLHSIIEDLGRTAEPWDAYVKLGRLLDGLKMLEENLVNPKEKVS